MTAPQEPPSPQRIELADHDGVVRVVLGMLDHPPGATSPTYGISVRGPDGAERVALSVDDQGPTLVFVRGGNIALQLGVDDPSLPGDHAGPYVTLADASGAPLLYVSAGPDGSLHVRAASASADEPG